MIEINAQYDGSAFHPYSDRDQDEAAAYRPNQIVTLRVSGVQKNPSVRQLGLFWSACTLMAENTDDRNFRDKDMVARQLKVALNFVDLNRSFVDKHGSFHPFYMSISFANLRQIERTRFIDRAFDQLAEWMGIDRDTLVEEAMARCRG